MGNFHSTIIAEVFAKIKMLVYLRTRRTAAARSKAAIPAVSKNRRRNNFEGPL